MGGRCLIADADPLVRAAIRRLLEERDWEVLEARNSHEAHEHLRRAPLDAVLLDDRLPGVSVLELLPELRELYPHTPLMVLAENASIDSAVRLIKLGAEQFLPKPVELPALLRMVERLYEARRTRIQPEELDPFLGTSPLIRTLEATARRVLDSDRSILIQGETGTGKGVLACWLHSKGPRAHEPLVQLNCAGLSPQFLETELFGHERGAFTSAVSRKQGLLERAHRGTVFLDEVGDMDPLVQPKLLKVLEERRFRRLGEVEERSVDIRLVAATHQDLVERVRTRQFRGDLFFRISTLPLRIPALRERPEDISLLSHTLLEQLSRELGRPGLGLTAQAEAALRTYPWPGNMRELRNVLERAVLLSSHPTLRVEDLEFNGFAIARMLADPHEETGNAPEPHLTLREVERRHITQVLEAEGGHVGRAAQRLGIPRSSLYQKLKNLGISSKV
ncbi:sigma-54-dependent transcriptional regulator [Melittangium boletus]|uniref:Sigma-54-dependent Fis family transcriptional regulator n=1 Tax=Melittangium boletus DSM 14713 TaxID=1294270 RepID=A0A250IMD4_9BACT|nr:sigma-54 dependent transcriptional regulator [Melittangium boletus]ATB32909.1 sigma-54-dependent Fis family transcriptional regulator [Melittangium boletus DSM 14713]